MRIRLLILLILLTLAAAICMPASRDIAPAPKGLGLAPTGSMCIRVAVGGEISKMDLDVYVYHVLSAEMPASFEPAALSAQAVAARTYALSKSPAYGGSGCAANPGADVCADHTCCQAYAADDVLIDRWGGDYAANREKMSRAALSTAGWILTYGGEPILALYHAASGGRTEDVEAVFLESLPYLRGVASPGETGSAAQSATVSLTYAELNRALSGTGASAKSISDIEILSRLPSGRVEAIRIGSCELSGAQLRQLLSLRSANFTVTADGANVAFQTIGSGHGVGMSQSGADAMARAGSDYQTILMWYYTGAALTRIY